MRAALFNDNERPVESHRVETPDPTGLEFDAEALWHRTVVAIGGLNPSRRACVRGVVIVGHIGTVFVDDAIRPVVSARGWADSWGVVRLERELGDHLDRALDITGRPKLAGGALAASVALRELAPGADRRVAWVLSPKDLLTARLCGVIATDYVSAAYSGASDVRARDWSQEILEWTEMDRARLPAQRAATDKLGPIDPTVARSLGLPLDAVILVGAPDGTAGATLLLAAHPEAIADIAGTTDVLASWRATVPTGVAGVVNPYLMGAGWTVGGPTGVTGGALAHWRRTWPVAADKDARDWGAAMTSIPPGSHGLTAGVALSGSRFPRWDAAERGWLRGLDESHGRAYVLRAVVEAAAFTVREGLEVLDPAGSAPVAMAGGHSRTPEVAQLRADVFERTVLVSTDPDATIRGAAMIGSRGLGLREPNAPVLDEVVAYVPDPARSEIYRRLADAWSTDSSAG